MTLEQSPSPETPKGKRPAFQFYPGDWQRDPQLRMCSLGARGLWIELMALMHWATPYGHLAMNGSPMTEMEIARLVGESPALVRKLLRELEKNGVSSKTDAGVIYSRRMVRDEALRLVRAKGGKDSLNNPNVPRPKDTAKDPLKDGAEGYPSPPSFGGSPSSSVSSSSSSSPVVTDTSATAPPLPEEISVGASSGQRSDAPADAHRSLNGRPARVTWADVPAISQYPGRQAVPT